MPRQRQQRILCVRFGIVPQEPPACSAPTPPAAGKPSDKTHIKELFLLKMRERLMYITWALRDAPRMPGWSTGMIPCSCDPTCCRDVPAQRKRFGSSAKLSRRVPRSCRPGNNVQSRQLLLFMRAFSTLYGTSPASRS